MIDRDENNVGEVAADLGQAGLAPGGYLRRKEDRGLDRIKDAIF